MLRFCQNISISHFSIEPIEKLLQLVRLKNETEGKENMKEKMKMKEQNGRAKEKSKRNEQKEIAKGKSKRKEQN